jgi:hypothetical protein
MSTIEADWTWAWSWWGTLVAINVINVIICVFLFIRSRKDKNRADAGYLRQMGTMGLIFVSVALYRSVFVSSYLRQLAWFDSVLNSSLLIRCLAIFAELSFAGLIARSLMRMNEDVPGLIDTKNKFRTFLQTKTPIVLFICIFIANIFATAATITKIDLLFALEETFWGIGFVSLIPLLIMGMRKLFMNRHTAGWGNLLQFRILVVVVGIFAIGYSLFELGFNLPIIYWPEAIAQLQMSNPDPAFRFGFQAMLDAFLVVHQTRDLSAWGGMGFIIWHTGYFSVCVWMVLFLMTGPRLSHVARADTNA